MNSTCSNPATKSILGNVQAKTSSKFYFNLRTPITLIMCKNGFKKNSSNLQGWWGTSLQGWTHITRPMMESRIWWINVKTFFPTFAQKILTQKSVKHFHRIVEHLPDSKGVYILTGGMWFYPRRNTVLWEKTKRTKSYRRSRIKVYSKLTYLKFGPKSYNCFTIR